MDFENYVYSQIGKRVKKHRCNLKLNKNKTAFLKYIESEYNGEKTGLNTKKLNDIENGERREDSGTFLTKNQFESLRSALNQTKVEFLFGNKNERESLLKSLLFTLLLNNKLKDQKWNDTELVVFEISHLDKKSKEQISMLSDSLIKYLIQNKQFVELFSKRLILTIKFDEKYPMHNFQFLKENQQVLSCWISSEGSNIISKLISNEDDFNIVKCAFESLSSKLLNILSDDFEDKLDKYFNKVEHKKMMDSLEISFFIDNIFSNNVFIVLTKEFHKQLLNSESSLFYLHFFHYYQQQNEMLDYILKERAKARNSLKPKLVATYNRLSLHSDILALQDFHLKESTEDYNPNRVLYSLYLAELAGLPTDVFDS